MNDTDVQIPDPWDAVDPAGLKGTVMVVGAPDSGKSTFARFLYRRLCSVSPRAAFVDGDPGQATLGPPTTMTLALPSGADAAFPPRGETRRSFVGSVTPGGHMLSVLTGAARLMEAAFEAGAGAVVYDTTGLIEPRRGGLYLKLAKIDLLRPGVLFALERGAELRPLLLPLARSSRVEVVKLPPSPLAKTRDVASRRAHRAGKFREYFEGSSELPVAWKRFAVFPAPGFAINRLVALEDAEGFTLGLGIVSEINRVHSQVKLHTPVASLDRVDAIRLGDVEIDPVTFEDRRLER